ncbi:MAG TPA: alpha-2-macroglobulin family protein, partial [Armatimonadota bacterium]|nr:alpha-2-macroglobulin family protein [Armatimonadota bacterium]
FPVIVRNPRSEKVYETKATADEYGGFAGEFTLPKDATLGVYEIRLDSDPYGGSSFRVEEYKKPEFEVNVDAPTEPVMLGDKITATIKAKYYFGSPVTEAKVKYKVLRTPYSANWYPIGIWDWFYGPGYWWFAYDTPWFHGWRDWGCQRPIPIWWGWRPQPQPEVVAEAEVPIGPDGTVKVEIDTALAKAIQGDMDHKYEITAEVTDQSRRTIVGQGTVLVARKPFKVYAWVDRGHYRIGDVVKAEFAARTLDNKPVQGKGELRLLKITYRKQGHDLKPVETEVQHWTLDTDAQGNARQQMTASEAGQYRLSYRVTDVKGHTIEGGYLFTVRGKGFDSSKFRFNDIELITDKREYQPGDTVKLMIATNRNDATVLLFIRPTNSVYLEPKVLHLEGKVAVEEIPVTKKDMPNFFVEAVTVSDGKVYSEVREIVVPPEKRVLNVDVVPSAQEYKPGEKAKVTVKLTDINGKPYQGSTVVSLYDKSVEYISGGSNVPDIKEFFWKWRRSHRPTTESSLLKGGTNIVKPGEDSMDILGIFGDSIPDETRENSFSVTSHGAMPMMMMKNARALPQAAMAPMGSAGARGPAGPAGEMMMDAAVAAGAVDKQAAGGAEQPLVQPTVRSNFADTALWVAALTTNANGEATVDLTMPENLTTWKAKVWAMGSGTAVGEGAAEVVTRKNLIVRLQAPRFFTQKDEVVISANVHNYLKTAKQVQVALELEGGCLTPLAGDSKTVQVAANGETRVDWRVKVTQPGEATIRVKALTNEESDAMQQTFPVYVHGMLKMDSFSGVIRLDQSTGMVKITVPAERRPEQTRLEVRYSPTLAGAMVDALPYLVDYPYGCTEQTLNRFLPTVLTQHTLLRMGLDLKDIQAKRTNLNAQEIGDDQVRAQDWKRMGMPFGQERNPVFDQATVNDMVLAGLERLESMQCSDGGWGWFSGWGERSYPHTTALVVHGLQLARTNGVALVPNMLERGVQWLKNYQNEQVRLITLYAKTNGKEGKPKADAIDAFVYMVLTDEKIDNQEMRGFLYRDRNDLPVYAKCMFGLALNTVGDLAKRDMLINNIDQYLVQDDEDQTAYLKLPENNWWWCWYGSEYEAQAYYLKLLSVTDPKGEKASRLVKYLINNRKHATYWNSTRDTAIVVEAFADYLRASGEATPDMTVQVRLDGQPVKTVKIDKSNLFSFDNKVVLEGAAVTNGQHTIELTRSGSGPLYYNAYLTNFTLEDPITKAGLEIKVNRKFYKLIPEDATAKTEGMRGEAVDLKVEKYRREELKDLSTVKSGDLLEVELEIDSKNDYEYLLFEDMKAAGCEPVDVRSGYGNNDMGAYMELRDDRVSFFVRNLARGKHSLRYRLRAEIPGQFSALPTRASALYAPELKANSDEIKLKIED